jgi:methylated-DNA-protein-cysteine methyltransferase-like protein
LLRSIGSPHSRFFFPSCLSYSSTTFDARETSPFLDSPAKNAYYSKPRRRIFLLFFRWHAPRMSHLLFLETLGSFGDRTRMSWDAVYRFVQRIPRGKVLTYGALAKTLRLPGGARTAGRAMAATPSGKGIPWHRVLGERGKILIREPYASLQRKLLESEGVAIAESRVDLKRHLWKPPKAAHLKDESPRKRIRK